MAHINLSAVQGSITVQVDANWEEFTVNGNVLVPPGQQGGTGSVTFKGKYFGSPTVPVTAMAFLSGSGSTAQFWLGVVTFTQNWKPGFCDVAGTVVYGNASTQGSIASALASVPVPFDLNVKAPGQPQLFSANMLTGAFSVTA